MSQGPAEIFESLRPDVLARLVEVRSTIDHAFARIPEDRIREQFDMVLARMTGYLASEDPELYRGFASRFLAMRVSDGVSPENLIHAVVAIGDVVVQVARQKLEKSPARDHFVNAVARMNFAGARMLVELLAEELERRRQQLSGAGGGA